MFTSVKLHDAIVNILIYPSLTGQTLLTADTVCLPGNHEIHCVSCVSRLPSTKSVLQNRFFPLTALEPRAPGARSLELVKTFLVGSRSSYPTLPPTDHRLDLGSWRGRSARSRAWPPSMGGPPGSVPVCVSGGAVPVNIASVEASICRLAYQTRLGSGALAVLLSAPQSQVCRTKPPFSSNSFRTACTGCTEIRAC